MITTQYKSVSMKCFNEQFKNIKKFMFLCGLLKEGIICGIVPTDY